VPRSEYRLAGGWKLALCLPRVVRAFGSWASCVAVHGCPSARKRPATSSATCGQTSLTRRLLDLPRPRREEYTICTAVAPEDVFTVRTYGDTRTHYGQAPPASAQIPRRSRPNVQVRKLQPAKPRNADKSRDSLLRSLG
jgi:hypothetical protein